MGNLRSNISFIRLFSGRLTTNAGDSMYMIAAMWLVYELTGSSAYTGLAAFLIRLPTGFQFLVGPLVDRWRFRPVLVGTQLIQCFGVLLIPLAAFFDQLSVWVILFVMTMTAIVGQFAYPAQNALLPEIVEEKNLVRANSLLSSAFQSANIVLNALSGVLITVIGAISLFVVNAVTFVIAAFLYWGIVFPSDAPDESDRDDPGEAGSDDEKATEEDAEERYLTALVGGINYLRGSLVITMVLGTMVANFAMGAAMAVLPEFADGFGGPEMYGLMMAVFAGGAFVGTLGANLVDQKPWGVVNIAGFWMAGLALFAALVVPGILPTAVFLFFTFVPIGMFNVMFFSMIQSAIANEYLGRVTSVVASLNSVTMPIGALLGGVMAGYVGVTLVLGMLAGALLLLGCYFFVQSDLRRLPPIAESNESTLGISHQ